MSEVDGLSKITTASGVVLEATGDGPVMLPDGFSVADASFERSGEDLILTEPDGNRRGGPLSSGQRRPADGSSVLEGGVMRAAFQTFRYSRG